MKAVIQRVSHAQVEVSGQVVSQIGRGILTLLGVEKGDTEAQIAILIQKICNLRIFEDVSGKMNHSLTDRVGDTPCGEHLIVSQFTLAADCTGGRRPSFSQAENPEIAQALYLKALDFSRDLGIVTAGGVFRADMKVTLTNDGPATFVLET